MHQKQNQRSQGLVRQLHWKIAQGLSNKCHYIFMKAKALFQYVVLVHWTNSLPSYLKIKQDLQTTFISTIHKHSSWLLESPFHNSTNTAKITAFKDQRMVTEILFIVIEKTRENTVTGIQQTRI